MGTYWAHNDSGAKPRLFAIDQNYEVRVPDWLRHRYASGDALLRAPWPGVEISNASLVDWEEIARVGDRLYIGDVGNNGNARRDLGFYELREPVPGGPRPSAPRASSRSTTRAGDLSRQHLGVGLRGRIRRR